MTTLARAPKYKNGYVKKGKGNKIFARDDAPDLWVKWVPKGA
jgi:hypothetical protein